MKLDQSKVKSLFWGKSYTEINNLINTFLPKNNVALFSISQETDANKVHHLQNVKHCFDLSKG